MVFGAFTAPDVPDISERWVRSPGRPAPAGVEGQHANPVAVRYPPVIPPHIVNLRSSRPGRPFTALLAALVLAACGGAGAEQPDRILREYANALEDGRSDDAYRLLSDEARRTTSLEAFRRMVKDSPTEVRELGRSLGRPTGDPVVSAKITTSDGRELPLVLERGAWKIDLAAIDLYAQDTPKRALRAFLLALDRKRWDVLLRFIPDARRDGIDVEKIKAAWEGAEKPEVEALAAALRLALPTVPVQEAGDRATLDYGSGTIQLVRERGSWKIESFGG